VQGLSKTGICRLTLYCLLFVLDLQGARDRGNA
jgi:hypothetical protein